MAVLPGVLTVAVLIIVVGCAASREPVSRHRGADSHESGVEQRLRAEITSWLGTPHRLGGLSRRGIDCSGLVVVVYEALFDRHLPRTTTRQMRVGRRIERSALRPGDLVFFKPRTKLHHVGIYLGQGEFVHTSTSRGVMVSRMDDDFWRQCYLTGRRLL